MNELEQEQMQDPMGVDANEVIAELQNDLGVLHTELAATRVWRKKVLAELEAVKTELARIQAGSNGRVEEPQDEEAVAQMAKPSPHGSHPGKKQAPPKAGKEKS